jgi:hypothetical protein
MPFARLTAPDGQRLAIAVDVKRLINTRDVPAVLERVQTAAADMPELQDGLVVLVARYFAPTTRERIATAVAGYVDATLERGLRPGADQPGPDLPRAARPRALTDRLREAADLEYAVTGSLAAERFAPYAPPRLAMLYVEDPARAVKGLGPRETQTGANVALAAARYRVVFDRAQTINGLRIAAPSQVAVDVLSGPGRKPQRGGRAARLDGGQ